MFDILEDGIAEWFPPALNRQQCRDLNRTNQLLTDLLWKHFKERQMTSFQVRIETGFNLCNCP